MKHVLDFEKPMRVKRKLEELRKYPETHSLGIASREIAQIEKNRRDAQTVSNLTAQQSNWPAIKRPFMLDYLGRPSAISATARRRLC
jgi:hypothetical protein